MRGYDRTTWGAYTLEVVLEEESSTQAAPSAPSHWISSDQTRLTDSPAIDRSPSWSPDGAQIVFESNRDGNLEIYVMDADGTNQTNLTDNPNSDARPSWTPNGDILFHSNRDGDWEIYSMTADGSNETNLTNSYMDDELYASMSPDSSSMAYMSDRNGYFQIHEMPVGGTVLNDPIFRGHEESDVFAADWILGDEFKPEWSPDGTKIVFYYRELVDDTRTDLDKYTRQISVMNSDGTERTNLTENPWQDYWPSWSPDGTKILFNSNRDGSLHLYLMNPDGSDQTRITNLNAFEATEPYSETNSYIDRRPSWSPDGTKIVFESDRDGNNEIYVMELDENLATSPEPASQSASSAPTGASVDQGIIYVGDTVGANLASMADTHYWNFEGIPGQRIFIEAADAAGGTVDPYIELFGPDEQNLLAENDDGPMAEVTWPANSLIDFQIVEAGTHTVVVRSHPDPWGESGGDYELSIYPVKDLGVLDIGTPVSGNLSPGEKHYWHFDAVTGQIVSIKAESQDWETIEYPLDTYIEFHGPNQYGSNDMLQANDDDWPDNVSYPMDSFLSIEILETASYAVMVSPAEQGVGSESSQGAYLLSVQELSE